MKRGDLENRLYSNTYQPQFRSLINNLNMIGSEPLGSLARFSEEIWDPTHGSFEETFPYIEIAGVGLDTNEYVVSQPLLAEAPSRARQLVRAGDILVSLTRAHRGAVVHVLPEHDGAIASTGFAVIRDVDGRRVDSEYLRLCLVASFGSNQMLVRSNSGNYPAITKEELSKVLIPLVPVGEQQHLVAQMSLAMQERKEKLSQAEELLAEMDGILLISLGIAQPLTDSQRVFAIKIGQMSDQSRLDSDYYHPERVKALRSMDAALAGLEIAQLADKVTIERELLRTPREPYLSLASVRGHTGELADTTVTALGACYAYQTGDVLFARLRPYLNKVHRAESGGTCSTEFRVLRISDTHQLLPDYLAAVLRSRLTLAQTVHMMTGNPHPRLPDDDLLKIRSPIPKVEVQQGIVNKLNRRREDSRRLRLEADTGWQVAKQRFEEQLFRKIAS